MYHIRLIRCRGYSLFHCAILHGYYSRAATIRERRLLLIRRQTTTLGTSEVEDAGSFVDIDDDEHEVDENELVLENAATLCLFFALAAVRRCARGCSHARTYHSNTSHGFCSRVATMCGFYSRAASDRANTVCVYGGWRGGGGTEMC